MSLLSFYQDKKENGTLNSFDKVTLERLIKEASLNKMQKDNFAKSEVKEKSILTEDPNEIIAIGGFTRSDAEMLRSKTKSSFNWSKFDDENDTGIM